MLGVISKMKLMDELLKEFPLIIELYADTDFTFEKDSANFYALCSDVKFNNMVDFTLLLHKLSAIFDESSRMYFANSSMDVILEHRKLIWRKGSWYL